jgi:hypothetical protein
MHLEKPQGELNSEMTASIDGKGENSDILASYS